MRDNKLADRKNHRVNALMRVISSFDTERVRLDAPSGLTKQYQAEFKPGMWVKFTKETGCNFVGLAAEVVSSRYVSSESWSGWIYKLTNDHLIEPIEIGSVWLELTATPTQTDANQSLCRR